MNTDAKERSGLMMSRPGKARKLLQATALLALLGAGNAWGWTGCIIFALNTYGEVVRLDLGAEPPEGVFTVPIPRRTVAEWNILRGSHLGGSVANTEEIACHFNSPPENKLTLLSLTYLHPAVKRSRAWTGGYGQGEGQQGMSEEVALPFTMNSISGTLSLYTAARLDLKPGEYIFIPQGTPMYSANFRGDRGGGLGEFNFQVVYVAGDDISSVAELCTLNNNAPLDIDLGTSPASKVTGDIRTSLPRKTVSIPVRCTQPINHPANMRITGTLVDEGGTSLLTSSNDALGIGFLTDGTPAEAVTASQLKVPARITAGAGTVNLEVVAVRRGDIQDIGPFNASATLILSSD